MSEARVYQDAQGGWIYFDGVQKQRFPTEQEARVAERETAVQVWEKDLRSIIEDGRTLIRRVLALNIDAADNEIAAIIKATPDGELLPGTTIHKEDAAGRAALFLSLTAWLEGQAEGQAEGVTRRTMIFRKF